MHKPLGTIDPPGRSTASRDRRPLKSRAWTVMQRLASVLARVGVTADAISVAGMAFGVLAGVCLASTSLVEVQAAHPWLARVLLALAAGLVQLRLLCNLLDGMVAIEGGRRTRVGVLYNELPDRVSDVATLVGAGYAASSEPALGWLAATLAMMTAYIRAVGKGEGAGNDFSGPMAKPHRMATMTVACVLTALWPDFWSHILPNAWFATITPTWIISLNVSLLSIALAVVSFGCVITCVRRLGKIARTLRAGPAHPE
jgi:phosphatidylglycerophosphate synthase